MLKLDSHLIFRISPKVSTRMLPNGALLFAAAISFSSILTWASAPKTSIVMESDLPTQNTSSQAIESTKTTESTTLIGHLPYSNQWLFDRTSAYLYLSQSAVRLTGSQLKFNHFTVDYSDSKMNYYSLDYFTRLLDLANVEGTSFFRHFGVWSEYSIGFGSRRGQLFDNTFQTSLNSESSDLTMILGKLGLELVYDQVSWFKPYVGISSSWYQYRHNSSLNSAEDQGSGGFYGPVLGAHMPLRFLGKASVYLESQKATAVGGNKSIVSDSTNTNFGLGLLF